MVLMRYMLPLKAKANKVLRNHAVSCFQLQNQRNAGLERTCWIIKFISHNTVSRGLALVSLCQLATDGHCHIGPKISAYLPIVKGSCRCSIQLNGRTTNLKCLLKVPPKFKNSAKHQTYLISVMERFHPQN